MDSGAAPKKLRRYFFLENSPYKISAPQGKR